MNNLPCNILLLDAFLLQLVFIRIYPLYTVMLCYFSYFFIEVYCVFIAH